MDRVIRIDERLAAMAKPPIQLASGIFLGNADCVVVCAGFEDRAVAFLREATGRGFGFRVIVIDYLPAYADNRLAEVLHLCEQAKTKVSRLTYDRKNPAGFGDTLRQAVGLNSQRIFLDVSGMSRLLIVQALVALCDSPQAWERCFIAYSEAQSYPPTQQEVEKAIKNCDNDPMFEALFLSSGVFDVTIVPELSPASLGANQSRVVVFPSFNTDQLTALRAELQPSRLSFIHGVPPSAVNQWRTDAIARLNRIDDGSGESHCRTSTFDYRETLDCLLNLYAEFSIRERLLVSPTGSKMQTVAVGLFCAFVQDVQIVYPTPREFRSPKDYTTGVGALHILPLREFGSLAPFCAAPFHC